MIGNSGIDPIELDHRVRIAAFEFLIRQTQFSGDVLPRKVLEQGFLFEGQRVPLIGPQGIFKPAVLPNMPLSITTIPIVRNSPRPYNDEVGLDGLLLYRYRGDDPQHPDNRGLRRALDRKVPLIYLYGIVPGKYMPVWPVYIEGDDICRLTFSVSVDDSKSWPQVDSSMIADGLSARRQYITTTVRQRLHQRSFRERVLLAYKRNCAICRLRHEELLEVIQKPS